MMLAAKPLTLWRIMRAARRGGWPPLRRWRCAVPALKFRSMDQDSTENPKAPGPGTARRGSQPDLPPQEAASADIDPATAPAEDDDEALLPEIAEPAGEAVPEGPLAIGRAAIEPAVRLGPTPPGGYRLRNAANEGLFGGQAKNV